MHIVHFRLSSNMAGGAREAVAVPLASANTIFVKISHGSEILVTNGQHSSGTATCKYLHNSAATPVPICHSAVLGVSLPSLRLSGSDRAELP